MKIQIKLLSLASLKNACKDTNQRAVPPMNSESVIAKKFKVNSPLDSLDSSGI